MKKLSTHQLERMIDDDVVLIDVLPFDHYSKKHLPGAFNVPVGEEDFAQRVEEIAGNKHGDVVVYCSDTRCDASLRAAEKLEAAHFEHVYAFEGGVEAWGESHLPFEGSEAAPARNEWDGNPP